MQEFSPQKQRQIELKLEAKKEAYAQELLRQKKLAQQVEEHIQLPNKLHNSQEDKLNEMRRKVAEIKAQKEVERAAQVKKMRQLQFKQNNSSLRDLHTKLVNEKTTLIQGDQIQENILKRQEQVKKDKEFHNQILVHQSKLIAREVSEQQLAIKKQAEATQVLVQQIEEVNQLKAHQNTLKAQEKLDLLRKLEIEDAKSQKAQQERLDAQFEIKKSLDLFNQKKKREILQQKQANLSHELQQLEIIQKESQLERIEKHAASIQLRQEYDLYNKYLLECRARDAHLESQIKEHYEHASLQMWALRELEWNKEAARKKQLLESVIRVQEEQITEKLESIAREREEAAKEHGRLQVFLEAQKAKDLVAHQNELNKKSAFQHDLREQTESMKKLRMEEKEKERKEIEAMVQADLDFQKELKKQEKRILEEGLDGWQG